MCSGIIICPLLPPTFAALKSLGVPRELGAACPPPRPVNCTLLPQGMGQKDQPQCDEIPLNPQQVDTHKEMCHPIVGTLTCTDTVAQDRASLPAIPPASGEQKVVI